MIENHFFLWIFLHTLIWLFLIRRSTQCTINNVMCFTKQDLKSLRRPPFLLLKPIPWMQDTILATEIITTVILHISINPAFIAYRIVHKKTYHYFAHNLFQMHL